jgi:hypothetical protein
MSRISGGLVLSVVVLTACGGAAESTSDPETPEAGTPSAVPAATLTSSATAAPAPTPTPSSDPIGFPCDVRAFLQTYCATCHAGNYPATYYFVPTFTSRDDLLRDDRGQTLGQAMVMRMTRSYSPMPPASAPLHPSLDEVAIVTRWVNDGMPAGPCGPISPP